MPLDLVLAECETRHRELLVYHVIITVDTGSRRSGNYFNCI